MDILDILKDKSAIIKELLKTACDSEKITKGLRSLKDSENIDFKVEKLIEITANQNIQISQLSLVLLCYAQSTSFDTDVAIMLNKMGRGEEALKQMFENKLK